MSMKLNPKNEKIYREIFNWIILDDIDNQNVHEIADRLGFQLSPDEIYLKSDWKKFKKFRVYGIGKDVLFYIKEIWELGAIKEVLAHKIGAYLDPDLLPANYVFGQYTSSGWLSKNPVPFLVTMTVPGHALKRKDVEANAFMFGRQYMYCKWLSLYDCNERHFFLGPDGFLRRIDLGLAFTQLNRPYQGFDVFFPKTIYENMEFKRGVEFQRQLSSMRFEVIFDDFLLELNALKDLVEDELFDFNPVKFKTDLLEYWKREGILNEFGRPQKIKRFLVL